MKCFMRFGGMAVLVLWIVLGLINPAAAAQPIDLSSMSTDGIMSQMEKTFDGLNAQGRKGHGRWHHGFPDPKAFEYLLELAIEHVPANPDTGFPKYYRITGKLFPEITFELRLPPGRDWNKKFYMAGCGGFCGNNDTSFPDGQFTNNLNWGLLRGYAAATTDSGHSSWVDGVNQGRTYSAWAEDNRRGEIDWGYRSVHEVTIVCKALVHLFYHRPARYAYFAGCSTGGRMAIMEALRFPEDFDGVISGAPALEYTGLVATWMSWIAQAVGYDINTGVADITFDVDQIGAIQQAVLDQCDGIDGAEDGLIMDPRRCPAVDFSGLGLSGEQLAALEQIYSTPVNRLGAKLYEGVMPYGSEIYWPTWVPGVATTPEALSLAITGRFNGNFNKFMAFQEDDPDFTAADFDFDNHPALLAFMGKIYNATSTQLRKYKKMGGKILMYHGWADPIVPPARTIAYYEAAVAQMGGLKKTQDFFRLFMVPGMDHCSTAQGLALGGLPFKSIGLDDFDALTALENWVERDTAPDEIMASGQSLNGETITRPLFPYPLYPKYIGGDPKDPGSYMAENDGSVRWKRFRKDTFYAFEIPELSDMPIVEGEGVHHFQPYDHNIDQGTYDWQVWSPSMFEGVDYKGFNGQLDKE
jgi:pimeloyl-ACP methyl ester carboxylesterase